MTNAQASSSVAPHRRRIAANVLVVEDDYCIARDIAHMLQDLGATVIGPFSRMEDALDQLAKHAPDMAVLDVNIRGKKVFPLAEELQRRKVPLIFITGYNESDIPPPFRQVRRITKPCLPSLLIAAMVSLRP